MSKQDRQGVRTATDLERKYTFGSIRKIEDTVDVHGSTLNKVEGNIVKHTSDIEEVSKELAVVNATVKLANESSQKAVSMAEKTNTSVNSVKRDVQNAEFKIAKNTEAIASLSKTVKDEYATTEYVDNAVQNAGGGGSGGGNIPTLEELLGYVPSFIKVHRTADVTNLSTSYNYCDPLTGGSGHAVDIQEGNLSQVSQTIGTFGDRSNFEVQGVLIGKDINRVRVTANVTYSNQTSYYFLLKTFVCKVSNGQAVGMASMGQRMNESEQIIHNISATFDVAEGDFICLMGYRGTASRKVDVIAEVNSHPKMTHLCVEAIG